MHFSENKVLSQQLSKRERLLAIFVGALVGIVIAILGYFLTRSLWCLLTIPICAAFGHSLRADFPATWSKHSSVDRGDSEKP
jgi:hypothetical protein